MKRVVILVGFVLAATVACARQSASDSSTGTASAGLSPIYSPGKCHFRLKLNGGTVSVHNASSFQSAGYYPPGTENWSVPLLCYAGASQDQIDQQLDAKKINGTWVWYNPGAGNVPENPPFTPEQHFHAYALSGSNWKGTAITYDDTTGDKATRGRNLFFCLVETGGSQVLCGGPIPVRALVDPPSTSTLPKIMAVLKTIEFVDASVGSPTPASAAAAH